MKASRLLVLAAACSLFLGGCATVSAPPPSEQMFQDRLFGASGELIDPSAIMAMSPAMRAFLDKVDGMARFRKDRREALVEALNTKSQLRLDYDSAMTRTAAEAFEARSGNCMSLVLMAAAFAKELGLTVRYRNVFVDPTWSRSNDLMFLSGHVNLTLGEDRQAVRGTNLVADGMTIDFMPSEDIRGQRAMEIGEQTILAMFMNNRAAESLHEGRLDAAYAWTRAALRQDPKFMTAYNTLGVIYRRHGNAELAERAFRYVLGNEPANTQAMSNLVLVLKDAQRGEEARVLQARLDELQPYPPFRYFDYGVAAMKAGEYEAARRFFSKELERAAYYHEFHFWLALANYGLGDVKQASKQIALAMENSTTGHDRDLYAAKLAWLNAQQRKSASPTTMH